MTIKSNLIALAVVCVGTTAAVVAQPPGEVSGKGLEGVWLLKMSVHDRAMSAVAICERDGGLEQFAYQTVPSTFANGARTQVYAGIGSWAPRGNGQFDITFKTELPNKGSEQVKGIATLSASHNEVTGSAKVEFLNQDGTVVYAAPVTLEGQRAPTSRLTAER